MAGALDRIIEYIRDDYVAGYDLDPSHPTSSSNLTLSYKITCEADDGVVWAHPMVLHSVSRYIANADKWAREQHGQESHQITLPCTTGVARWICDAIYGVHTDVARGAVKPEEFTSLLETLEFLDTIDLEKDILQRIERLFPAREKFCTALSAHVDHLETARRLIDGHIITMYMDYLDDLKQMYDEYTEMNSISYFDNEDDHLCIRKRLPEALSKHLRVKLDSYSVLYALAALDIVWLIEHNSGFGPCMDKLYAYMQATTGSTVSVVEAYYDALNDYFACIRWYNNAFRNMYRDLTIRRHRKYLRLRVMIESYADYHLTAEQVEMIECSQWEHDITEGFVEYYSRDSQDKDNILTKHYYKIDPALEKFSRKKESTAHEL